MKNYVVTFSHEEVSDYYCPETMYFTEKGLKVFLDKIEKSFNDKYKN